jgi:beta-lactamase regulating signal transducer with metallopeptidase domain
MSGKPSAIFGVLAKRANSVVSASINHLWQSSLFLIAIALLTLPLRRDTARTRYWLWFTASAKFLIPFSLLSSLGEKLAENLAQTVPTIVANSVTPLASMTLLPAVAVTPIANLPPATGPLDWNYVLLAGWLFGAVILAARWMRQWFRAFELVHESTEICLQTALPVRLTQRTVFPALIGLFSPTIILPQSLLAQLSPVELEAVLAHETVHWRHRDMLWSLPHRLVELLFWFYPPIWWLGRKLNEERERACDEGVLESGHGPEVYAAALVQVCALHLTSSKLGLAEMGSAGLTPRIREIMNFPGGVRRTRMRRLIIAAGLVASGLAPISAGFAVSARSELLVYPGQADQHHSETLRQAIAQLRSGKLQGDLYSTKAVQSLHKDIFALQQYLDQWGELKGVRYAYTDEHGHELYDTAFEHGHAVWTLGIEHGTGKVAALYYRVSYVPNAQAQPHPGTEVSLRNYVLALETGNPNYDAMEPDLAAVVHMQLPIILKYIKQAGDLRSITFLDRDINGMDVFQVRFSNGLTEWHVAPLTPDGRAWFRHFDVIGTSSRVW